MLIDSAFKFSLEMLKKCMFLEPKNNFFLSPHLLYQNLLVVYFGVIDDLEDFLRQVLYIPDDVSKDTVKQYYFLKGVHQFCYKMDEPLNFFTCKMYDRLWITDTKMVSEQTIELFSSYGLDLHFGIPPQAHNYINNVVKWVTQRCIQNLLPPNSIDNNTEMILLSTIYCEGQLDVISDVSDHENTKNVIHSKNKNFNNGKFEQLDAYIMEVPCKTKNVSTFFLYPSHCLESNEDSFTESDRIIQLIERLTTKEGSRELRKLLNKGIEQQTDMMFPTFKIEQDIQMYELLALLDVQELASSDAAYLDDFTLDSNLKLGDVKHRISIEMTKNDIIVAACNTFFTSNSCSRVPIDTVMDTTVRFPCVCLIYDRAHQNILFCGVLLKDNKESEKPCNDGDEA